MIDLLFGPATNTIEVCSYSNNLSSSGANTTTVDINPDNKPDIVDDAQVMGKVESDRFNRWRADPPYNEKTAQKMYDTKLPETSKLLTAGARVIKPGGLMFLLLGPQNFQWHPPSIKRIGWVAITIVPNQELRALHIYYKSN
jgi:hypothetical protein